MADYSSLDMPLLNIDLTTEQDTQALGHKLASLWQQNNALVIFLSGELGAGKTTLARGFIQYFGFTTVKSPTYTLVESYPLKNGHIHHLDCYRLNNAEELEMIGIRDYDDSALIVEWPEMGKGHLPKADIIITLDHHDSGEYYAQIEHNSNIGSDILSCLADAHS